MGGYHAPYHAINQRGEFQMQCPECEGLGMIHIPALPGVHQRYDMICPVCDGTGEIFDPEEFPNSCPACGEPIKADETWCEHHKGAEQFE
jgi:DnaJ-class molecular chaperone